MELSAQLPTTSGAGSIGSQASNKNFSTFLKLLTTQMTNQNPLSPMDTHEFTGQLVQFSQVEQMMNMSSNFAALSQQATQSNLLLASQLIGKDVALSSNGLRLTDQRAEISYNLGASAKSVTASILNAQGAVVCTLNGTSQAGNQSIVWDGRDNRGQPMPDGTYQIKISALGADGKLSDVTAVSRAKVLGVSRSGTDVMVQTNVGNEPLANIVGLM